MEKVRPRSRCGSVSPGITHMSPRFSANASDGESTTFAGATRLRIGSASFRGTGDVVVNAKKAETQARGRWALGVELLVAKDTWLTASTGTSFGGPEGVT